MRKFPHGPVDLESGPQLVALFGEVAESLGDAVWWRKRIPGIDLERL